MKKKLNLYIEEETYLKITRIAKEKGVCRSKMIEMMVKNHDNKS